MTPDNYSVNFYASNGISFSGTFSDAPKGFYAYEFNGNLHFKDDSVQFEVFKLLFEIETTVRDLIFENANDFNFYMSLTPMLFVTGGISSECMISKDAFNHIVTSCNSKTLNAVFYFLEYRFLQDSLQDTLINTGLAMSEIFKYLSKIERPEIETDERDGLWFHFGSQNVSNAYEYILSFFVCAASSLDYLTKCSYECINLSNSFDSPQKLTSSNVLYGGRESKKLKTVLKNDGTIFCHSSTINLIEELRNDLVHNKSLNERPCVLINLVEGAIRDRCIPFPDFDSSTGRLHKWHSRNRFYSQNNTVNELLPKLYFNLMTSVVNTLNNLLTVLKDISTKSFREKIPFNNEYISNVVAALYSLPSFRN